MVVPSYLKSFQALELALRTGSLRGAADILSITPAAVGQRIKTLEDYLGIDLVVRGRSGLRPTPALSDALPHLSRAFIELAAAAEALDFQRFNDIQIAANSDWVELWLLPRLPEFRAAFPNTRFCINGEGDAPLRLGQTDVEVSFGPRRQDARHAPLFADFLIPISSPENAARIGRLRGDRLEGFPLLHLDFYCNDPSAIGWPEWVAAHGHRASAAARGIRFQRIASGLEAVLSNAGLMICGLALVAERLAAGAIVLPFSPRTGVWTAWTFQARFRHESSRGGPVARFRDWLEAEAGATRRTLAELAGSPPPSDR